MRILFLTQVLPYPLDAGPKVRAYYVLRHLAQQHEVTLVSFVRPTDTAAALDHLRQYCCAIHTVPMRRSWLKDLAWLGKSLVMGEPFIIARDWVQPMARLLAELMAAPQPFDAIHADQLWMAPYALWARQQTRRAPVLTLDQHNAVYLIPQRMAQEETNPIKRALLQLEARKLAAYESAICRQFDHVMWVTQEDYQAVAALAPAAASPLPNAGVIPICVDPTAIAPLQRQRRPWRVTFVGGLHYPPNAQGIGWFAEQVFPQVRAAVSDAVLTVIGKQPPALLKRLGLPAQNLDVTGFVSDLRPYLAESAVFVVPLHAGGGMRVKILDAWGWGVPIVSTKVGTEGIHLQAGENILLADTPTAFAEATVRLLQEPAIGEQMVNAGRQWVTDHYSWQTHYQGWDRIYGENGR